MGNGRFVKGQVAWNKGLKRYWDSPTEFKKGIIPWNKKEPIKKICPTCKKEFYVKPSLNRIICCSISCSKKGKPSPRKGIKVSLETRYKQSLAKIGIRGEQHPLWRGGLYNTERSRTMQHIEYKTWRRSVFVRDIFTCKDCRKQQTYIVAHHLKSYKDFSNLRFDINNGITLCLECHRKRHKNIKVEVQNS